MSKEEDCKPERSDDDPFEGYGPQKDLSEILEELGLYCMRNGGGANPHFHVVLPKAVQEAYTESWKTKAKHGGNTKQPVIKQATFASGIVEIHNTTDQMVVDR